MTDVLCVADLTCPELEELIDRGLGMKREPRSFTPTLPGLALGYLLHRPSAAERVVVQTAKRLPAVQAAITTAVAARAGAWS